MSNTRRPSLEKKETRAEKARREKERDDALDRGIAFTDVDGTRLVVTLGDVRGSHDAQLRRAIGLDFYGLLDALAKSPGTDLLAATMWFGRLVNDHNTGQTLEELLDEFTYATFASMDMDDPKADPKAGEGSPEA